MENRIMLHLHTHLQSCVPQAHTLALSLTVEGELCNKENMDLHTSEDKAFSQTRTL